MFRVRVALSVAILLMPTCVLYVVLSEEQSRLTVVNLVSRSETNTSDDDFSEQIENGSAEFNFGGSSDMISSGDWEAAFVDSAPSPPTDPGGADFPFTIECPLIALERSEFTYVDDERVLFRGEVKEVLFWTFDGDSKPVICSNFKQNGTILVTVTTNITTIEFIYPKGFAIASYVGCSLSIAGSSYLLVTYSLFSELRTLPSLLVMSLSVAFLVGDLLIVLGSSLVALASDQSGKACVAVAIFLHYFFLARFCWSNMIAFEMVRSFTAATKLVPVVSSRAKRRLFVLYSAVGWGVPLLITMVSVIVNFSDSNLIRYGVETCWINDVKSAINVFVTPLVLSLTVNLITFVWIIFNLCKSTVQNKTGKKPQLNVRLYVAVFSVMGLTWIFGFVAILARSAWAWYPFIVLNSTQALIVSLSFACTKKIARDYLDLLAHSVTVTSSSVHRGSSNTTSSSGKNKISPIVVKA